MSKDLISRKALLDEIDRRQKDDPYKKLRGPVERWIRRWGYDILWTIVRYFPAAEVPEVKQGEWKWEYVVNYGVAEKKAVCSLCGEPNKRYMPPYCPHCGAEMKKVDDE